MTSWEDVIDRYGLKVKWQGRQWRGPCPIHGGDNASSFVITPGEGFICFACGAGGGLGIFHRLMGDEGAADEIEALPGDRRPVPTPVQPTTPLGPLDTSHPYFRERGIHEATARFFGIGYFRGTPPFGRRIVAPLHDSHGQLVGHIGRAIADHVEPRYLFQRGVRRSEILFNLHRVKQTKAESVIVVEGIFDALAVYQLGFPNVVATLGCEVTENQRALLSGFRKLLVLFDDDDAGTIAAAKLEEEFGLAAMRLQLPKADPASIKGVLLERLIRSAAPEA
jgi:DNA primase